MSTTAPHGDLSAYHPDHLTYSNGQTGFNTAEAIQDTSDRCTDSILNLLTKGNDADVVNSDFKENIENSERRGGFGLLKRLPAPLSWRMDCWSELPMSLER